MLLRVTALTALCLPALLVPLAAQTPPPPRFRTQIDLGYVVAAGNSRLSTLNLAEQFVMREARWKLTQSLNVVNGHTSGVETANNLRAGVRVDYDLGARLSVYGQGLFERDRFAGLRHRFEESAGLSWGALTGPRHILNVEAGLGRNQQAGTTVQNFWASRVATRYRFTFRPGTYVEEKAEVLSNLQTTADERLNSEAVLVAPLSARIAIKVGYVVRFDHQPEPGRKQTDTVFSTGLQIVF